MLFVVILLDTASSLRILGIFPHLGASHFRFFHPIVTRLAEIGHQVTVVSHFPEKNPHPNYHDLTLTRQDELSVNLEVRFEREKWEVSEEWSELMRRGFYFSISPTADISIRMLKHF